MYTMHYTYLSVNQGLRDTWRC